jgi:hypothetical protein
VEIDDRDDFPADIKNAENDFRRPRQRRGLRAWDNPAHGGEWQCKSIASTRKFDQGHLRLSLINPRQAPQGLPVLQTMEKPVSKSYVLDHKGYFIATTSAVC